MFTTNIRKKILNKDCRHLLDDLINSEIEDTVEDVYIGYVVNNKDPIRKGRVKVRSYNLFSSAISDDDIPWAIPNFSYLGSKKGSFIVPPVNALVKIYFDRRDIYCPIYEVKGFNQNEQPDGILENYPDTMILYNTDNGEYFSVNRATNETKLKLAGTIAIGTSQAELLDLIDQTLTALISSVVPTSIGPQQLSRVTDGTVLSIKNKLATIKGTI
jgi:hypothetical protein